MMSVRITAAGAVAVALLAFLTAPVSACDERFIKKCETRVCGCGRGGGSAGFAPVAKRKSVKRVTGRRRRVAPSTRVSPSACARPGFAGSAGGHDARVRDRRARCSHAAQVGAVAPLPRLHRSAADRAECVRGSGASRTSSPINLEPPEVAPACARRAEAAPAARSRPQRRRAGRASSPPRSRIGSRRSRRRWNWRRPSRALSLPDPSSALQRAESPPACVPTPAVRRRSERSAGRAG